MFPGREALTVAFPWTLAHVWPFVGACPRQTECQERAPFILGHGAGTAQHRQGLTVDITTHGHRVLDCHRLASHWGCCEHTLITPV